METKLIVALITLAGSTLGTIGGILISNKLTTYRIEQLEKKVDRHNHVIERIFILEEKVSVANHRIHDLEGKTR